MHEGDIFQMQVAGEASALFVPCNADELGQRRIADVVPELAIGRPQIEPLRGVVVEPFSGLIQSLQVVFQPERAGLGPFQVSIISSGR